MKAAIYHRLNNNDINQMQEELEYLKHKAIEKGFDITLIEFDCCSGLTYERNGLLKIKNVIKNNQIDTLIIKDISRIGRDIRSNLEFTSYLQENNIKLYIINGETFIQ